MFHTTHADATDLGEVTFSQAYWLTFELCGCFEHNCEACFDLDNDDCGCDECEEYRHIAATCECPSCGAHCWCE